jgi:hypothetical protein
MRYSGAGGGAAQPIKSMDEAVISSFFMISILGCYKYNSSLGNKYAG